MVARTKAEGRENDALQGCHRPDRGAARTTRSGSPERALLVPKGIEPRDLSDFEVERSASDEGVGVEVASLPTQELLQVDVQSRLQGADRDGAGGDPATDVRQEVVGVVEREGDSLVPTQHPTAANTQATNHPSPTLKAYLQWYAFFWCRERNMRPPHRCAPNEAGG
jgi:hypothetical protein